MKQLGYYAKYKDNNLYQFKWEKDGSFLILVNGIWFVNDPAEFEILDIGYFTADSKVKEKPIYIYEELGWTNIGRDEDGNLIGNHPKHGNGALIQSYY